MLDPRIVFVLRCLYRQREGRLKAPEIWKKPEIWKNSKNGRKLKNFFVNTSVNTKKLIFFLQKTCIKGGIPHAEKYKRNYDCP